MKVVKEGAGLWKDDGVDEVDEVDGADEADGGADG